LTVVYHHLFINYEIRDTDVHESPAFYWEGKGAVTLFFNNTLDQAVSITVKGNIDKTPLNAVQIGDVITVGAGTTKSLTLTPETTGYLPYILVVVQCSTAPTSGNLSVTAVEVVDE